MWYLAYEFGFDSPINVGSNGLKSVATKCPEPTALFKFKVGRSPPAWKPGLLVVLLFIPNKQCVATNRVFLRNAEVWALTVATNSAFLRNAEAWALTVATNSAFLRNAEVWALAFLQTVRSSGTQRLGRWLFYKQCVPPERVLRGYLMNPQFLNNAILFSACAKGINWYPVSGICDELFDGWSGVVKTGRFKDMFVPLKWVVVCGVFLENAT